MTDWIIVAVVLIYGAVGTGIGSALGAPSFRWLLLTTALWPFLLIGWATEMSIAAVIRQGRRS